VCLVKHIVDRVGAGAEDIGQILLGSALREDPRSQLASRSENGSDFNFRIFFLEAFENAIVIVAAPVQSELALGFGGPNGVIPFFFPVGLAGASA